MRRTLLALPIIAAVLVLGACKSTTVNEAPEAAGPPPAPELANPDAKAQELIERYLNTLKGADTDVDALSAILAEDWQLVRSDSTRATKTEYLEEPAEVHEYEISNIKATTAGDTMVASFDLKAEVTIGDRLIVATAPRLASFVWDGSDWLVLSWANFGVPPEEEKS